MQNIVLIGGGSGISPVLTELSKKRGVKVAAVVTVFDNGGSTGILRKQFGIPAVGDFRKCVSATAGGMAQFFERRVGKHAFGNLIIADLIREKGLERAFEIFAKFAGVEVVPVSFSASQMLSEFENGETLLGEEKLDKAPKRLAQKKITNISLTPQARLNPRVKKIFQQADKIVVGSGSLFGSLLVNFEVAGFRAAFEKAQAKKILVMNATRELGCRGENDEEIVERFGVEFDEVLLPKKGARKWDAKLLARKLC